MAKINYSKYKGDVDHLIVNALNSTRKAQILVQVAAVAILQHVARTKDWTVAKKLVDGMSTGSRADSLVVWFNKYGIESDDTGFTGYNPALCNELHIVDAKVNHWYDAVAAPSAFKGFNLEEQMKALDEKASRNLKLIKNKSVEDQAKVVVNQDLFRVFRLIRGCSNEQLQQISDMFKPDELPTVNVAKPARKAKAKQAA